MVVFDFFAFFTICFVGQISAAACAIITALRIVANLLTVAISILTFVYVDTCFHFLVKLESVATGARVTARCINTHLVTLICARFALVNVATCPLVRFELETVLTRAESGAILFATDVLTTAIVGIDASPFATDELHHNAIAFEAIIAELVASRT